MNIPPRGTPCGWPCFCERNLELAEVVGREADHVVGIRRHWFGLRGRCAGWGLTRSAEGLSEEPDLVGALEVLHEGVGTEGGVLASGPTEVDGPIFRASPKSARTEALPVRRGEIDL